MEEKWCEQPKGELVNGGERERERDLKVTSKLKGGEGVKAIKVESDLGLI